MNNRSSKIVQSLNTIILIVCSLWGEGVLLKKDVFYLRDPVFFSALRRLYSLTITLDSILVSLNKTSLSDFALSNNLSTRSSICLMASIGGITGRRFLKARDCRRIIYLLTSILRCVFFTIRRCLRMQTYLVKHPVLTN